MKKITAFILSLLMVIGCFALSATVASAAANNNWIAGKSYTITRGDGAALTPYSTLLDTTPGTLLTDGKYRDGVSTEFGTSNAELKGVTVGYTGTGAVYAVAFDLGTIRSIGALKFFNASNADGSRGFEFTKIGYSKTSAAPAGMTELKLETKPSVETKTVAPKSVEGADITVYNYFEDIKALNNGANIEARYVVIYFTATRWVVALDEIELWDVAPDDRRVVNASLKEFQLYDGKNYANSVDLLGEDAENLKNGAFVGNEYDEVVEHNYIAYTQDAAVELYAEAFAGVKLAVGSGKMPINNRVAIIIDASQGMTSRALNVAKATANEIAAKLLNPEFDGVADIKVAIIAFNGYEDVYVGEFTDSIAQVNKEVSAILGKSISNLGDALAYAAEEIWHEIEGCDICETPELFDTKGSIIVISDGLYQNDSYITVLKDGNNKLVIAEGVEIDSTDISIGTLQVTGLNNVDNAKGKENLEYIATPYNTGKIDADKNEIWEAASFESTDADKLLALYDVDPLAFFLDPTITVALNGGEAVEYGKVKTYGVAETPIDFGTFTYVDTVITGDFDNWSVANNAAATKTVTTTVEKKNGAEVTKTIVQTKLESSAGVGTNKLETKTVTTTKRTEIIEGTTLTISETMEGSVVQTEYVFVPTANLSDDPAEGEYKKTGSSRSWDIPKATTANDGKTETVEAIKDLFDTYDTIILNLKDGKNTVVVNVSSPYYFKPTTYTLTLYKQSNYALGASYTTTIGTGAAGGYVDGYGDDGKQLTDGKNDASTKPGIAVQFQGAKASATFVIDLAKNVSDIQKIVLKSVNDNASILDNFKGFESVKISTSLDNENWTELKCSVTFKAVGESSTSYFYDITALASRLSKAEELGAGRYVKVELVSSSTYLQLDGIEVWGNNGEYTAPVEPPVVAKFGDINADGDIDALDASILVQADAGLITLTEEQIARGADANGDKEIDVMDASVLLQFDAGLITVLPGAPAEEEAAA